MGTVIEAAGNVAFSLIANSIRDVYLAAARPVPRDRRPPRDARLRRGRRGDRRGDAGAARAAMAALAAAQEARLLEALA